MSSTSSRRSFGHHDQRVARLAQRLQPVVGLLLAPRAFELERERHDPDRQRAELARDPRDDRRRAGAGAAALAGGDEHHVGAAQRALDRVVAVLGGAAADLRVRAGAEALGDLAADVDLRRGVAHLQLLDVGVDRDEVDLVDPGVDHAVDRVQAGAADADDADDREVRRAVAGPLESRRLFGQRVEPARERAAAPSELGSGARTRAQARPRGSASARARRARAPRAGRGRPAAPSGAAAAHPARSSTAAAPLPLPGRGRQAALHACWRDFWPLSTSFARSRYIRAASPDGS